MRFSQKKKKIFFYRRRIASRRETEREREKNGGAKAYGNLIMIELLRLPLYCSKCKPISITIRFVQRNFLENVFRLLDRRSKEEKKKQLHDVTAMFRKVMRELSILVPTDFILTHSQFMGFLREVQSLEQLFNVLKQKGKEINLREKKKRTHKSIHAMNLK